MIQVCVVMLNFTHLPPPRVPNQRDYTSLHADLTLNLNELVAGSKNGINATEERENVFHESRELDWTFVA